MLLVYFTCLYTAFVNRTRGLTLLHTYLQYLKPSICSSMWYISIQHYSSRRVFLHRISNIWVVAFSVMKLFYFSVLFVPFWNYRAITRLFLQRYQPSISKQITSETLVPITHSDVLYIHTYVPTCINTISVALNTHIGESVLWTEPGILLNCSLFLKSWN